MKDFTDEVYQRFDDIKAIGFNGSVRELWTDIAKIPVLITNDEFNQKKYEVGADFPKKVVDFWLLESDSKFIKLLKGSLNLTLIVVTKITALATHYSITGWQNWPSVPPFHPHNSLRDAVATHPRRCLKVLAMTWGLEFGQLQRPDGEAEQRHPAAVLVRKRTANGETKPRRFKAVKMADDGVMNESIISNQGKRW